MFVNLNIIPKLLIIKILIIMGTIGMQYILCCDRRNTGMHSCLHVYLERDFSTIQDLIHKSPTGHVVIDQREFIEFCHQLDQLKQCYEEYLQKCVSYVNFAHLKRVVHTVDSVSNQLCSNQSNGMKHLIENGYCIEETRKTIDCRENHLISSSNSKPYLKWPLVLAKMLRFEVGAEACQPLIIYKDCLAAQLGRRCEPQAQGFWNNTVSLIINQWCNSSPNDFNFLNILLIIICFLFVYLVKVDVQ
ncbi:uncharacterized protein LOC128956216 [Oppia nitens]|uniref:uncharacterized protein LOC128956216 n=1 Tax=Oppia nitens TaxID=1686743 RepID=UPI0023DA05B8|nr:uncharacterized protein LOC128956216 [Oppia nitens]